MEVRTRHSYEMISDQVTNQTSLDSSEGVQLGSVRSDYGVLGIWTTAQHDRIDPVGE